ncbi:MAG: glycine cleavage system aminomethyltransferase GcvT [Candidatus Obscuribacterales bacterium]|nr:glycine cleavage system aminomethyltransferase GcvT [Candidatus Obscuribacterales bacterium]
MTTMQLKETPLASWHRENGGRMVDFAGWNMPVQYKSIVAEHMAVRTKVGLFDVSHMGEFIVTGAHAHQFVQYMIANDLDKLTGPNMALYTQFVMPDGGTVDDLIVYRRQEDYLLVVNASNIDKDWAWLKKHIGSFRDVDMINVSDEVGLLALQGPHAKDVLSTVIGRSLDDMKAFTYGSGIAGGIEIGFGRTGYTGEDGFEIFVKTAETEKLWKLLLHAGAQCGIEPCGLGARDTLRLEAGLPLYGHELSEEISPLEAGIGWSVKLGKSDFSGKEALVRQKENGFKKQIICIKAEGKALPRQDYAVYAGQEKIGIVTSGSQGIFVGYPIAFAMVPAAYAKVGQALSIEIRGSHVPVTVVKRPFYQRP